MRVVVVGSLPPPENERTRRLLAEVLRYRARGDDVTVVAPSDYAVAHQRVDSASPAWPFQLARLLWSANEAIVQVEPGFPLPPSAGRLRRAASLASLAACLKASRARVSLWVPSLHSLPLGLGGRIASTMWSAADRLVAGDRETEAALAGLGPVIAGKVSQAEPAPPAPRPATEGLESAQADLQSATALVRARAAAERANLARRSAARGATLVRVPLWEWVPEPGAGVPRAGGLPEVHRPVPVPAPAPLSVSRALLYAVEKRPVTRPLAQGARRVRALVTRR